MNQQVGKSVGDDGVPLVCDRARVREFDGREDRGGELADL
jgi:hypothetical protein